MRSIVLERMSIRTSARARVRASARGGSLKSFRYSICYLVPVALRSRQMILSNSSHCLRVTPQATP